MYEIGQQVIYGIHGVCTICNMERMQFGKEKESYYILKPVNQPDARFYVPVDNPAAVAKMHPLMTKEELLALLHDDAIRCTPFQEDDNQRKILYKELIGSGERGKLMGALAALHRRKTELSAVGRKLHQFDDNFLKDAENLINAEVAQVFGLNPEDVTAFILHELEISH